MAAFVTTTVVHRLRWASAAGSPNSLSTSGRPARIALLAVAALLAAACATEPTASPPSPTQPPASMTAASAAPTASPKPSPTPPPLGAAWRFVHIGAGEILDIAHGDAGYVAVGTLCSDDCPGAAAAWFSPDGLTWVSLSIPDSRDVYLRTVATDGTTWYAAGERYEQSGLVTGRIWRSMDARTWQAIELFDVGQCNEGCPSIGQLAARPGSALLTTPFGVAGATSDGYLIARGEVAWELGGAGSEVRRLALGADFQGGRIATDGRRVVVLEALCEDECFTRAWSSADGRTGWVSTDQPVPIAWTERQLLVFVAGSFITAGQRAPNGVGVYASPNGVTWTAIRTDLSFGERVSALAGSDRELVIAQEGDSGIWISRAP